MIKPEAQRGQFPAVVSNTGKLDMQAELLAWQQVNRGELEQRLAEQGAVLFRGFPLVNAEDFDAFVAGFGDPAFTYQDSLSNAVRINFTKRVFTANEAPPEVEIFLHHEMAQTPISPRRLFFFCASAAERGGETPLCRSDRLFTDLCEQAPELAANFVDKGLRYLTRMASEDDQASGQGRGWKSTLSVKTKEAAETKLADLGYTWDWLQDDAISVTTPRLPAVRNLSDGSQSFYNQLIAAFMGWQGVREDPHSAIRFGDDSPIPIDVLELLVELAKKHTYDLAWQAGDVAWVDNHRVMHGRRAFSGSRKRQVLVAMAA